MIEALRRLLTKDAWEIVEAFLFHNIIERLNQIMASQADLDAAITSLQASMAQVQATGSAVQTAVQNLVAAYNAQQGSSTPIDLSSEISELTAVTSQLSTDATQGAAFAASLPGQPAAAAPVTGSAPVTQAIKHI